jgi:ribonuclease VapC
VIVDASALLAILLDEPSSARCLQALLDSPTNRISAANFLEVAIVVDRLPGAHGAAAFDELIEALDIIIEPVTAHQAKIARAAYRRFGRGSGHPAKLNFGDCLAYALVKDLDEPLLFIGQDFTHTDIRLVLL